MPDKILLTGASGFVGGHVVKELSDRYELHAISTQKQAIPGIVKQYSWSDIDRITSSYFAVIHLAGLAHDTSNASNETAYFEVNRDLTQTLINHCSRWNVGKFIYLSSVKAVVDSTHKDKLDESVVSTSKHVYGRSKLAAEKVILDNTDGFEKLILRPVMIYGKGQKGNLKTLENLISKNIPFPFGKWNNRRSLLNITNLTHVINRLLAKPVETGVYFVADDEAISTVQLLKYIANGVDKRIRFIPIPNGLISMGIRILPRSFKQFTDKVLGSLEVDNGKLKKAIDSSSMPLTTSEGFKLLYS